VRPAGAEPFVAVEVVAIATDVINREWMHLKKDHGTYTS
jgi:transcriptional regulator of acetoin/glycerol metabolism